MSETSLTFDPDAPSTLCFEVVLFPDNDVEGNESFLIIMSSIVPHVEANDSAVINIIDDDGKHNTIVLRFCNNSARKYRVNLLRILAACYVDSERSTEIQTNFYIKIF